MLKKLILTAVLLGLLLISLGCQTVSGLGRDITWTAEATSNLIEGN